MVIYILFSILLSPVAQDEDTRELKVEGFGTVHCPAGEWKLENYVPTKTPDETPDVVVLRKNSEVIERITILRYAKSITPPNPLFLCDSIADSTLYGLPSFLFADGDPMGENEPVHSIRFPTNLTSKRAEVTNIYSDGKGTNWMNHGMIQACADSTFVFVHSSPSVLSPETIHEVLALSRIGSLEIIN